MHIAATARRGLAIGLVLGAALAAAAQTRPDFTGEWVLNRQDSTLPRRR